jgi:glycosyltransferase involved in cell wall biosynthesis
MGALRTPIISLQHHALNRGRMAWLREPWIRLQIRGTDALPALSRQVAEEINSRSGKTPGKSAALPWGPDAAFYPRADSVGEGVLAAGRTGRDFVTFGQGASQARCPAEIICMDYDLRPEFSQFAANVRITTPKAGGVFTYPEMMEQLRSARVLAIPLFDYPPSLAGLTSLLDAIALGKPVIMTRHPLIDLDVEALGIGRWVEPNDVTGWRDAIQWFDAHPGESREMGQRARRLVDDQNFHSREFASRIADLFEAVLNQEPLPLASPDVASSRAELSHPSSPGAGRETHLTPKWREP